MRENSLLKRSLKSALSRTNALLGSLDLQLVPRVNVLTFASAVKRLKESGFTPAVVFDVGVAYGTPDLYNQFRSAKYFLIDPLPQSLPFMQSWAKRLDATIHNVALGEAESELKIDVRRDIGGSTFFRELGSAESIGMVSVPVRRFDSVFAATQLQSPCLMKIDVQGAELRVLEGMGDLIRKVDVFIIEVSSIVTLDGGAAHMFEVIDFLRSKGFTVYDIGGIGRRPLDNALAQLDVVFCKNSSGLISDRRWCA